MRGYGLRDSDRVVASGAHRDAVAGRRRQSEGRGANLSGTLRPRCWNRPPRRSSTASRARKTAHRLKLGASVAQVRTPSSTTHTARVGKSYGAKAKRRATRYARTRCDVPDVFRRGLRTSPGRGAPARRACGHRTNVVSHSGTGAGRTIPHDIISTDKRNPAIYPRGRVGVWFVTTLWSSIRDSSTKWYPCRRPTG